MLQLKDVQTRYGTLSREEFIKKIRCDWLVTDAIISPKHEVTETAVFNLKDLEKMQQASQESELLIEQGKVTIYPIIKRKANTKSDVITVGRANTNDLVIPDGSISKVHAYFSVDPESHRRTLCDMDSTNGTFIGQDRAVPNMAYILKTGVKIIFGQLAYTYYAPRSFYDVFLC